MNFGRNQKTFKVTLCASNLKTGRKSPLILHAFESDSCLFFYVVGCFWCTLGGLFLRSARPHNSAQTWGEATSLLLHSKTRQNHMFRWNWRSMCFLSKQVWWVSVSYSMLWMTGRKKHLHASDLLIQRVISSNICLDDTKIVRGNANGSFQWLERCSLIILHHCLVKLLFSINC